VTEHPSADYSLAHGLFFCALYRVVSAMPEFLKAFGALEPGDAKLMWVLSAEKNQDLQGRRSSLRAREATPLGDENMRAARSLRNVAQGQSAQGFPSYSITLCCALPRKT